MDYRLSISDPRTPVVIIEAGPEIKGGGIIWGHQSHPRDKLQIIKVIVQEEGVGGVVVSSLQVSILPLLHFPFFSPFLPDLFFTFLLLLLFGHVSCRPSSTPVFVVYNKIVSVHSHLLPSKSKYKEYFFFYTCN